MNLPQVHGASTEKFSFGTSTTRSHVELQLYIDEIYSLTRDHSTQTLKRVVIAVHGHDRNAWDAFSETSKARDEACRESGQSRQSICVVAPVFFNGLDKDLFGWQGKGSTGRLLVWKGNGWAEGSNCQYPLDSDTVSSFSAFDALLLHFSNRQRYPCLEQIVFAGHSAGGQLVARYAILGEAPSLPNVLPSAFIIANPSSFLYFTDERYGKVHGCKDYNEYKYGFDKISSAISYPSSRTPIRELHKRYISRNVHHLQGLKDKGVGDDRPQALAQGANRLERGENWVKYLTKLSNGWPALHTVDYIPGVGHDGGAMLASKAGIQRIFFDTSRRQPH